MKSHCEKELRPFVLRQTHFRCSTAVYRPASCPPNSTNFDRHFHLRQVTAKAFVPTFVPCVPPHLDDAANGQWMSSAVDVAVHPEPNTHSKLGGEKKRDKQRVNTCFFAFPSWPMFSSSKTTVSPPSVRPRVWGALFSAKVHENRFHPNNDRTVILRSTKIETMRTMSSNMAARWYCCSMILRCWRVVAKWPTTDILRVQREVSGMGQR